MAFVRQLQNGLDETGKTLEEQVPFISHSIVAGAGRSDVTDRTSKQKDLHEPLIKDVYGLREQMEELMAQHNASQKITQTRLGT